MKSLKGRCCCDYEICSSRRLSPCGNKRSGNDSYTLWRSTIHRQGNYTRVIVHYASNRYFLRCQIDYKGSTTCKVSPMCLHSACDPRDGGKFACFTSCRVNDDILKSTQRYTADNRWLYLAGSTNWHNHCPVCKSAATNYSKSKGLDGCCWLCGIALLFNHHAFWI